MSTYHRTAIRRIAVQGYRSLENVVVENIPDVVVLFGPNGSGKSNLLRAARLLLRAIPVGPTLAFGREAAIVLPLANINEIFGLRPDDFRYGSLPEIRVELTISLGTRALGQLRDSMVEPATEVELAVVFQHTGGQEITFWFDQLEVSDRWQAKSPTVSRALNALQIHLLPNGNTALAPDDILRARLIRSAVFSKLIQLSDAYRVPGGTADPQSALYDAFLSEDAAQRAAARRLQTRLASAGLFGSRSLEVLLIPVNSQTYNEKQIRFKHPTHGEIPLRNLGSGEQQLVMMLGQQVITPYPIAQVEEPEAHLHTSLMEPLANLLTQSVGDHSENSPDVDQLWIATHHHRFAIAPEFFDVSLTSTGSTQVERKPRDMAVTHFYEPSPYWDTLRQLVEGGLSPETVVSLDPDNQPVTARQILESVQGDRRLANEFVKAATRAFVLSLTKEEPSA
ncbi:MAG: AAA family ATPase [Polyangiaceae bacterium]|nr:AAA family ATPase [Polyangiaceae bacterium]